MNNCTEESFLKDVSSHKTKILLDQYVWACYAIVWGIGKYDELKKHMALE
jgi:hypothetical protein